LISALELLALNGVPLTAEDILWMAEQPEEFMIPELVRKLPMNLRQGFEGLASQLQMLLLTATRVRNSVDAGVDDEIAEVMDEEDHGMIKEQILKESVIQASKEAAHLLNCRDTWVKSTERRLLRLTHSAELAEKAQAQLEMVEQQLDGFSIMSKAKLHKAMQGFLEGNDRNYLTATFLNWASEMIKNRDERNLRAEYERRLVEQETKLIEMKSKAIENVKRALHRKLEGGEAELYATTFQEWCVSVSELKRERQEAAAIASLQAKMDQFTSDKAAAAKTVLSQMLAAGDEQLMSTTVCSWKQVVEESKHEKAMQAKVDEAHKKFQEFMEGKKGEAKAMLAKMGASTDSGLCQSVVTAWAQCARESKQASQLKDSLAQKDGLLQKLKAAHKTNASSLQGRVTEQMQANLLLRVIGGWAVLAKVSRLHGYYNQRMCGKRKQLDSVRTLFRSFADSLEEGLSSVDGDSSGRDRMPRKLSNGKGMVRSEHTVSLPDIKQRA